MNSRSDMCKTELLSIHGDTIINGCPLCQSYYLWHQNLMLSLDQKAFQDLAHMMDHLYKRDQYLDFPDGNQRVVLETPHADIRFIFTKEELITFRKAMEEARYMLEVYQLMRT